MQKFKDTIFKNKYLTWVQFFTNWFLQGILYADKSEKLYKLTFTILFSLIFFLIIYFGFEVSLLLSFFISFIIAHTLNWIINCNFYVLFVHRMKYMETSKEELFDHLSKIKNRLENLDNKNWMEYCVSHGGICRGTLNKHSDIDVSLIRKPGFMNMVHAIKFYVKEKKYADINKIPLDIFICDTPENSIIRSNRQNNPIVLLDHEKKVDIFYPEKLSISIEEAKTLNGIEHSI